MKTLIYRLKLISIGITALMWMMINFYVPLVYSFINRNAEGKLYDVKTFIVLLFLALISTFVGGNFIINQAKPLKQQRLKDIQNIGGK